MTLFDTLQATWPPAATSRVGPWLICEGQGGGQRVSAARAVDPVTQGDIPAAEEAMRGLGQHPLFMIRAASPGDDALDAALEGRGYVISDPTVLMGAPIETFATAEVPPVTAFPIWPPLQIMYDLWTGAGMDPARFAIMDRVTGPKTAILGRINAKPAGNVFVALHGTIAMVHGLEIVPEQRRNGLATHLMHACAHWAREHGAAEITLAVVRENAPAVGLYSSLGMVEMGGYHYRKAP